MSGICATIFDMRADRLVSILMLLQSHGRMSARELAKTLEVSVRTIYRDMDALSTAGIPVYAERGANGGCRLVENYRTELTGLSEAEAQALFLLEAPGPLDALEVGQKLRAALRKLATALPEFPAGQASPPPRIHLDWSRWGKQAAETVSLERLYEAIRGCRALRVTYKLWDAIPITQEIYPLGLVAKAGVWYLVWESNGKTSYRRAASLLEAELLEETFDYPEDFTLSDYWRAACAEAEGDFQAFRATVRATSGVAAALARQAEAGRTEVVSLSGTEAWVRLELSFDSMDSARHGLMAWGSAVEVLEPEALRLSIIDYAKQIAALYASRAA
jgi:predicted DNA-binding transcriptional regulator YafY